MIWYQYKHETLTINVYIQPGAKQNAVVGLYDKSIKVRIASAPIEGRANCALLKYMAQLFNVPIKQVTLKHGQKTKNKVITIVNSKVNPLSLLDNLKK